MRHHTRLPDRRLPDTQLPVWRGLQTPSRRYAARAVAAALLAALALGFGSSRSQAAETVRFGSVGGITDAGVYLADEMGFFKEAGLTVESKRMASAPALVTALATDQLDVAGIALTPGLFMAVQQGINVKIVGDKQSSRPGYSATRIVIRKALWAGSKEKSIAALKGKTIAISARASSSFYNVAQVLDANGMKISDVRFTQLPYPSMVAALTTGAVDAAYIIEPFLSKALNGGIAMEIADIGYLGNANESHLSVPVVYSEKFAKREKEAAAFMLAYMKGVRVYNDAFVKGKDKQKVIDIIARRAGVDAKVVAESHPAGLDPEQDVNIKSLQEMQNFFVAQKLMSAPTDLGKLVDTSFAKAAVAKLGPYK
ncbi:MAG TPA: ABC transporter substrate-binding protein [Xanthobacteraceae bacterium]|jgi:NitT/TauT family transport system substrate-binding protein|nr:ABC transporter substrate-binding protein [Xanthobacteraceae bacterium]